MNQASKKKKKKRKKKKYYQNILSCVSHTEHSKEHYSLVIYPTVSTIFISEHFEKATKGLKKLKWL